MRKWEHIGVVMNTDPYDDLLAEGWEPFAVVRGGWGGQDATWIHMKRLVEDTDPSMDHIQAEAYTIKASPGDTLVFIVTNPLVNREALEGVQEHLDAKFPDNEVVVVCGEWEIKTVTDR